MSKDDWILAKRREGGTPPLHPMVKFVCFCNQRVFILGLIDQLMVIDAYNSQIMFMPAPSDQPKFMPVLILHIMFIPTLYPPPSRDPNFTPFRSMGSRF